MSRTRILGVLFALLLSAAPALAFAAYPTGRIVTCDGTSLGGGKACTVCDIANTAQNVVNTGIYVCIFLSSILFMYAGGRFALAEGDMNAIRQARKIFGNVFIGLVIILSAWLIVDTIMGTLFGRVQKFGPWYQLCGGTVAE